MVTEKTEWFCLELSSQCSKRRQGKKYKGHLEPWGSGSGSNYVCTKPQGAFQVHPKEAKPEPNQTMASLLATHGSVDDGQNLSARLDWTGFRCHTSRTSNLQMRYGVWGNNLYQHLIKLGKESQCLFKANNWGVDTCKELLLTGTP